MSSGSRAETRWTLRRVAGGLRRFRLRKPPLAALLCGRVLLLAGCAAPPPAALPPDATALSSAPAAPDARRDPPPPPPAAVEALAAAPPRARPAPSPPAAADSDGPAAVAGLGGVVLGLQAIADLSAGAKQRCLDPLIDERPKPAACGPAGTDVRFEALAKSLRKAASGFASSLICGGHPMAELLKALTKFRRFTKARESGPGPQEASVRDRAPPAASMSSFADLLAPARFLHVTDSPAAPPALGPRAANGVQAIVEVTAIVFMAVAPLMPIGCSYASGAADGS